jgi:hypothetical protein
MPTPDEERVRRLLADARVDEPVPADVAARLDAVLAGLAAAPSEEEDGADRADGADRIHRAGRGDELARRRGRRRWLTGLTAAAALVVAGVVVQQSGPMSSGDSSSSTASEGSGKSAGDAAGGDAAAPTAPAPAATGAGKDQLGRAYAALGVQPLPPGVAVACDTSPAGANTAVVVDDAGRRELLVIRPVRSSGRAAWAAELLRCDTGEPVRSAPLPGR